MFPSIQKLIRQTAKDLALDNSLVEKVIMSQFLFVKNTFANPQPAVIRLEDLGKFSASPSAVRYYFLKNRKKLEKNPTAVTYIKAASDLARMRYPSQAYYLSRQFKKRFGSWHYKASTTTLNVE